MIHVVLLVIALAGCATATSGSTPASTPPGTPGTGGVVYRDDPDLQRVWLADGIRFRGYDAILIGETRTDVARLNPDGAENLEWARGVVRGEIATALRARGLFTTVAIDEAEVKPGSRVLRLENTIVEYEKGGGGARWFAGVYGAGQPVIRVRGRVTDGDRAVFLFDARRSGDTGLSRMFGGYRSDKAIQEEDIRDLAQDMADFMVRDGRPR
jgi:hypothetical protein